MTGAGRSDDPPSLSLVVTTLGRVGEIERLFESLALQADVDFDVTVVDQNDDDRLRPIMTRDWPFPTKHLHIAGERGASRGRNRGWRATRGRFVLFPDDDCWYSPGFLRRALDVLDTRGCALLAGRAADEEGRSINGRFEERAQPIDRRNVWTTAIEWMVFFRRDVLERTEGFDATIGIGASTPWQSSEIQDILLRAMDMGFDCWFDPAIAGHHEEIQIGRPDRRALRKARGYARGMGYVLRLHGYGPGKIAEWTLRPLGSGLMALRRGEGWYRLPYYGQVVLGRLEGALRRTMGKP